MPTDYGNQVNVVRNYGDAALGKMNPRPLMQTDRGVIISVGTDTVQVSGANVGLPTPFYPGELQVDVDHASGVFSWPSGDGSWVFGHRTSFGNGIPGPYTPKVSFMQPHQQTADFVR